MRSVKLSFIEQNQIAIITLDRPEVKHAFHTKMASELIEHLHTVRNRKVRAVIITSSTDDAFCTGADLKERKNMTDQQWEEQHQLFEEMFNTLATMDCPTITAMNGYALAGGLELALNTDMIIAGKNVRIGLTEVTRGIMPGGGGARLLPKRVPLHIAKEWLFTGAIIEAEQAYKAGLFNKLVETIDVLKVAIQLAKRIAENAPLGVSGVKKVANQSTLPFEQAFALEIETYNKVIRSADRNEGILAFNEKRKPIFKGE
jgi:enoyl-CoA hydratase